MQKIQDLTNTVILDVRTPEEYNSGHLKGSQNIDFYEANFKNDLQNLDRSKKYLLYCRSGNRSGQAARFADSVIS